MLDLFDVHTIRSTQRKIISWGRANFQSFPWRSETDPWLTLVAELFLQRTRASQVVPHFQEFREKYPTAGDLPAGGQEAVSWLTSRLGIHWRGPLMLEIAKEVEARGGLPPENSEELMRFKGIGGYTASAWLSLHRGKRAVIIDSNVVRWLSRMTGMPYNRDPRGLHWVQDLCERLTPKRVFRDYNYAVLDFTMMICARKPDCPNCPLRRDCRHGNHQLLQHHT
jgi:A/G-specific adenine glycosylase